VHIEFFIGGGGGGGEERAVCEAIYNLCLILKNYVIKSYHKYNCNIMLLQLYLSTYKCNHIFHDSRNLNHSVLSSCFFLI
jgi:hypothetical protein